MEDIKSVLTDALRLGMEALKLYVDPLEADSGKTAEIEVQYFFSYIFICLSNYLHFNRIFTTFVRCHILLVLKPSLIRLMWA